jgi:hypothetical protein
VGALLATALLALGASGAELRADGRCLLASAYRFYGEGVGGGLRVPLPVARYVLGESGP